MPSAAAPARRGARDGVSARVRLDHAGDAPAPVGWREVTTEAAFLEASVGNEPLLVRGAFLCRWATDYFHGRGIDVERVVSPSEELRELCPDLSPEQAAALLKRLGQDVDALPRPLTLEEVAALRWNEQRWWTDSPGPTHAARWALWWLDHEPDEPEGAWLAALAKRYASVFPGSESQAYEVRDSAAALVLLRRWLEARPSGWTTFPVEPTPTLRELLQSAYRALSLEERGGLFARLEAGGAHKHVLSIAAEASAAFFMKNLEVLTRDAFARLERYLSPALRDQLQAMLPAPEPGPIPADHAALTRWFVDEYLPFRKRHVNDPAVLRVAREFAAAYLGRYAPALSGSLDQENLAYRRVAGLASKPGVTLLVVLDGLSFPDMRALWEKVREADKSNRMTLERADLAFAPVPSMTEVAKPALLAGVRPANARDQAQLGRVFSKDADVRAALEGAKLGELLVWSLLDTDAVYHNAQSDHVGAWNAKGVLSSVAGRLHDLVRAVPDALPLRIVIATDHGRLLASAERTIEPPAGMRPHGRAAIGPSGRSFPSEGYVIEGDIAFLSAARFGLVEDAAIVLSEAAFKTIDGRGGKEVQPHGGVFPEEVLVPFWMIARDAKLEPLTARVHGSGRAGRPGNLVLTVSNPGSVALTLDRLEFTTGSLAPIDLSTEVGAMSRIERMLAISRWPTRKGASAATAHLVYRSPAGEALTVTVVVALESEEMYEEVDNPLEDLL